MDSAYQTVSKCFCARVCESSIEFGLPLGWWLQGLRCYKCLSSSDGINKTVNDTKFPMWCEEHWMKIFLGQQPGEKSWNCLWQQETVHWFGKSGDLGFQEIRLPTLPDI